MASEVRGGASPCRERRRGRARRRGPASRADDPARRGSVRLRPPDGQRRRRGRDRGVRGTPPSCRAVGARPAPRRHVGRRPSGALLPMTSSTSATAPRLVRRLRRARGRRHGPPALPPGRSRIPPRRGRDDDRHAGARLEPLPRGGTVPTCRRVRRALSGRAVIGRAASEPGSGTGPFSGLAVDPAFPEPRHDPPPRCFRGGSGARPFEPKACRRPATPARCPERGHAPLQGPFQYCRRCCHIFSPIRQS
jgi:hypothetical protein